MKIAERESHSMNGSHLEIKVISPQEALVLLAGTKRSGLYQKFIPQVLQSLQKLSPKENIAFHIPEVTGRPESYIGLRLMSMINLELKDKQISHRLRFNKEKNVLVSEPHVWA